MKYFILYPGKDGRQCCEPAYSMEKALKIVEDNCQHIFQKLSNPILAEEHVKILEVDGAYEFKEFRVTEPTRFIVHEIKTKKE